MTGPKRLTPEYIRQIMAQQEIPLRRKKFTRDMVNEVLRYGAIVGSTIEQHEQMERGMAWARQCILKTEENDLSFPSGTVILVDEVTGSKGRFTRSWYAPKGGLWMTLILVNTLLPENNLLIPMAAGVACCEVLRDYGINAHIKWVNDVLVEGKKISGILTESFSSSRSGEDYILVGLGINVNNDQFPAELAEQAIALKACRGRESDLTEITARLLAKLRWNIGLLYYDEARHLEIHGGICYSGDSGMESASRGSHLLIDSYKSLTDIFNRRVLFGFDVQKNPQFEATIIGLDDSGGLIMELGNNTQIIQHGGEIVYLD